MALESKGRAPQCQCVTQGTGTTDGAVVLLGAGVFKQPCYSTESASHIQDPDFDPQYSPKDKIEVQGVGGRLRDQEEGVFEYKFSSQDLVWSRFGNSVCSPLAIA